MFRWCGWGIWDCECDGDWGGIWWVGCFVVMVMAGCWRGRGGEELASGDED